jgi:nucleoside-diphosphate-sugar epimerase
LYLPIDENHPTNPHSPYNKSKLLAENLCESYVKDMELNIVTLRPFYVYGPSSSTSTFIPSIKQQLKSDNSIFLSHKNTKRDFLFVDDFVNLIFKIINDFPCGYNLYNVGSGKSHRLEDIIKIVENITGRLIEIKYNESLRPNDVSDMEADITAVTKKFNWTPTISIENGLTRIFNDSLT